MIILALVLFILEVKITSYGMLTVGGVVALALGSLMLIDSSAPYLQISRAVIAATVMVSSGFFILVVGFVVRTHRRRFVSGREGLVGERGAAVEGFPGSGRVFVHGEYWDAQCPEAVAAGEQIEVVSLEEGLRLVVKRAAPCRSSPVNRTPNPNFTEAEMLPVGLVGWVVVVALVALILFNAVKVLFEYERGVVFRLGRFAGVKGPGLRLIIPIVDKLVKVSLRTVAMDVPPQDVITKDNVSVKVNAVLYFRVLAPEKALIEVENYLYATSQLAQTSLRSVLGQHEMDDLLSHRDRINQNLQQILDRQTDPWGVKVSNVEIKHVDLPVEMQRAMARQAEAERERRSKVIHAEGEFQASQKLADAAKVISTEPAALQLRFLQTLTEISAEKNSTILFPIPLDLITPFLRREKNPPDA